MRVNRKRNLSHYVRKRIFIRERSAKIQISLRIRAVWSESSLLTFFDRQGCKVSTCERHRLWADSADAQANLRLCCQKVCFLKLWLIYLFWKLRRLTMLLYIHLAQSDLGLCCTFIRTLRNVSMDLCHKRSWFRSPLPTKVYSSNFAKCWIGLKELDTFSGPSSIFPRETTFMHSSSLSVTANFLKHVYSSLPWEEILSFKRHPCFGKISVLWRQIH